MTSLAAILDSLTDRRWHPLSAKGATNTTPDFQILAEFKILPDINILYFRNPELKIMADWKIKTLQNHELKIWANFKISAFPNPEFKMLAYLKILTFKNPEFGILADSLI